MEDEAQQRNDHYDQVNLLTERLSEFSDHSLVLALAAFCDDALRRVIFCYLADDASARSLLEGFNAPLGTFSARIKMAAALGLISRDQLADLNIVRDIRNRFSHTWETVTLVQIDIQSKIDALCWSHFDSDYPPDPRSKLESSIVSLIVELETTTASIGRKSLRLKTVGGRLTSMAPGETREAQISYIEEKAAHYRSLVQAAKGKERDFYVMLMERCALWMGMVAVQAPEHLQRDLINRSDRLKGEAISLKAQRT